MQAWARQANAQGITWVNASGDSGGADCVYKGSTLGGGPSVDLPAGIPEVTGVGGTTFSDGGGTYWNSANQDTGGSALNYIPETAWNDSAPGDPSSGGGGASAMFAKPSWQTGSGVPNDGARDVPDVSLASSADHDGYMVYNEGQLAIYGGTSAATPVFAGIAALVNQYLQSTGAQSTPGLGNVNPKLYALAQSSPSVFHDVATGDNIVTVSCSGRSRNCQSGSFGFSAAAGYDQATGLGSVDAHALAMAWRGDTSSITSASAAMTLASSTPSLTFSDSITITATVTGTTGGTPLGTVTFYLGSLSLGTASLNGSGNSATASITLNGAQLQNGVNAISATYAGSDLFSAATASVSVTVGASASSAAPSIAAVTNGASYQAAYAPGMILTVFGSNLAPATASAGASPCPRSWPESRQPWMVSRRAATTPPRAN